MSYTFYPPQVMESWPTRDRFLSRVVSQRGVGVLIKDGAVTLTRSITQDDEKNYDHAYFGGHAYVVDNSDAELLLSLGYPVKTAEEAITLSNEAHDGFMVMN